MKFIFLCLLISFLNLVKSDLPVHCLKHDIIGRWSIKASELKEVKSGHEMRCGHDEPSKEETSYLAKSPLELNKNYFINMKNDDEATLEIDGKVLNGNWTMVYDEGFEVKFENFTFMAFSKYLIEEENGKKSYKSQCYSTCVGWYNNKNSHWGCYQASKTLEDPLKITYLDTKNSLNIVEPDSNKEINLNVFNNPEENSIINSVMNMQFRSIKSKIFFGDKIKYKNKLRRPKQIESSFLEEQLFSTLKLDASFNKHALYIAKINTLKKNWNAALDPNFSNLSIRQLNKFAGIPRNQADNKSKFKNNNSKKLFEEDLSMLPISFDWKENLKPAGSQGNCGSCYVYSTIRMLQSRLKIKYNHDVDLSIQQALDCNFFNQGCNGGYPYLVMKFANEFQLIPEACKPYTV